VKNIKGKVLEKSTYAYKYVYVYICECSRKKTHQRKQSIVITMIQISYNSSWDTAAPKENTNNSNTRVIYRRVHLYKLKIAEVMSSHISLLYLWIRKCYTLMKRHKFILLRSLRYRIITRWDTRVILLFKFITLHCIAFYSFPRGNQ